MYVCMCFKFNAHAFASPAVHASFSPPTEEEEESTAATLSLFATKNLGRHTLECTDFFVPQSTP